VGPINQSRYHAQVPPVRSGSVGLRYVSHEQALLRISKLDKKTILSLAEGVYLVTTTGRPIDDLRQQASADRIRFAKELLIAGDKLRRSRPPQYRSAVSRYYYCMYHSMRAVVYFVHGGDDYQPHSDLPARIPSDFIDGSLWRNALKDARSHRNDADYEPYPMASSSWKPIVSDLASNAKGLLAEAESYLKSKGCGHI
jgi:uncharacterized protein (UPF0332 family)